MRGEIVSKLGDIELNATVKLCSENRIKWEEIS
jgi:hypothetical protein